MLVISGMADIPETSTTLLRELASDSQHARWGEFVNRYRPMMDAYMRKHFPTLEPDEIIQQTLIALIRIFPVYRYCPGEKGAFHNYLTGILRNKALKFVSKRNDAAEKQARYAERRIAPDTIEEQRHKTWRESVFEIALQQLLADNAVHGRTREVFRRIAVNGEDVKTVAQSFGITRNAADQMKSRMMARLRELVADLEKVDDARFESSRT